MRARFGIRLQLALAALALLVLPWIAAQFISRMESFLRSQQEGALALNARVIASALSDRPALFAATPTADPEAEERRRIVALFEVTDPESVASLGKAYAPSEEVERLLQIMGRQTTRVFVVDARSRVLGISGGIRRQAEEQPSARWLRPIASRIVPTPRVPAGDESKPQQSQIDRALIGVVSTSWRGMRDPDRAIVSSAQPIFVGDNIVGAVVAEETTDSILLLKQQALERLLIFMLVIPALALLLLLVFATRLATRVARLHRQAEGAIDPQGRITGSITPSQASDEVGDLSRTVASLLERLRGYNAYLEAMAGRLSHELRTPVAVVRSSLDNLKAQKLSDDARVYVERAGQGVERLSRLIARLSEGTRLERMLESAERELFDLRAVVAGCVEGYRAAYPARGFEHSPPAAPIWIKGVPDAFAQLLDKLVENAVDFAPPESAIRVILEPRGRRAVLAVENDGPPLPRPMLESLFDSMVSAREAAAQAGSEHLGLGLYIVRLVAEFHGGRARAMNLAGDRGVRFEIDVPAGAQNP